VTPSVGQAPVEEDTPSVSPLISVAAEEEAAMQGIADTKKRAPDERVVTLTEENSKKVVKNKRKGGKHSSKTSKVSAKQISRLDKPIKVQKAGKRMAGEGKRGNEEKESASGNVAPRAQTSQIGQSKQSKRGKSSGASSRLSKRSVSRPGTRPGSALTLEDLLSASVASSQIEKFRKQAEDTEAPTEVLARLERSDDRGQENLEADEHETRAEDRESASIVTVGDVL
jgi:hypothetical protein